MSAEASAAAERPYLGWGKGRCVTCGHHSAIHHPTQWNCHAFLEGMDAPCDCKEYVQPDATAPSCQALTGSDALRVAIEALNEGAYQRGFDNDDALRERILADLASKEAP